MEFIRYKPCMFYAVMTHREVVLIYIPAVWKLLIPPQVQIFPWLLANNKHLTRNTVAKRDALRVWLVWSGDYSSLVFRMLCCKRSLECCFRDSWDRCVPRFWIYRPPLDYNKRYVVTDALLCCCSLVLMEISNALCFQRQCGQAWKGYYKKLGRC